MTTTSSSARNASRILAESASECAGFALSTSACAELRVDDVVAWAEDLSTSDQSRAGATPRLSVDELHEILTVAWRTATSILPELLQPKPWNNQWTQPPRVELRLTAERQHSSPDVLLRLPDLIDFSSFGTPPVDTQLTTMSCSITALPQMTPDLPRAWTGRALVRMAVASGFLDAADSGLDEVVNVQHL